MWLSGPPHACGLVLLRACAAALESAPAAPLAFTIEHSANGLTASGAAVTRLAAARLQGWFMAPWPVAQGSRRNYFCCVTTRRRNLSRLRRLWRRGGALAARTFGLGVLGFGRLVLPSDTEQQKSAIFEHEDGATRHMGRANPGPARTPDGLNTQSVFARRNVVVRDVA